MNLHRRNSREEQPPTEGMWGHPSWGPWPRAAGRSPCCAAHRGRRCLLGSKAAAWSPLGARSWHVLNLEAGSYCPARRQGTACSCPRIPPTASRTAGCLHLASLRSSLGHSPTFAPPLWALTTLLLFVCSLNGNHSPKFLLDAIGREVKSPGMYACSGPR